MCAQRKRTKLIIPIVALAVIGIIAVFSVSKFFADDADNADELATEQEIGVISENIKGQSYIGRVITISDENFGQYDGKKSMVKIDGVELPIISWEYNQIRVLIPENITPGAKEIVIENPPFIETIAIQTYIKAHEKKELIRTTASPNLENRLEHEDFTLVIPSGSIRAETEIVVSKYVSPAVDENPFFNVVDEFEIADASGAHLFFDKPVLFGVKMEDEAEAIQTSFQIFDEYLGFWTKAKTTYDQDEQMLYLETNHFSSFRRIVSIFNQGPMKKVIEDYPVKLIEESWVAVKDTVTEEYIGVKDLNENFIVYYRVNDLPNHPNLPDTASKMAVAFSKAYDIYSNLFGQDNVPFTKKIVLPMESSAKVISDSIRVYIDPKVKSAVAKSATTGNIIMPSEYLENDLESTCAHELFHAVQYHQLGLKQLYIGTTAFKEKIEEYVLGNDTEVYRYFANNMWFIEATAEYAGRFIGTNDGIGAPIHSRIEANKSYYTFNSTHEYGISSFLDYVLSIRQTPTPVLGERFKEMWYAVLEKYNTMSSIEVAFDEYVKDKLNTSANQVYWEFWRDVYTSSKMPEVKMISGGEANIRKINKDVTAKALDISQNGVGVFRYELSPKSTQPDETTLTQSYWFEVSSKTIEGDLYRLNGLEMSDRVLEAKRYASINRSGDSTLDTLVPYTTGDSLGLVAIFSNAFEDVSAKVSLLGTALKWDNQEEIEDKVGKSTLQSSDKLIFTPTLPELTANDGKFSAVVTLNEDEAYKTEIDVVENGTAFEVYAPMKDLPPEKISVNIKLFLDRKLIHEYQSGEILAEALVYIKGSATLEVELTKAELPYEHAFEAEAFPEGEYEFRWVFANGNTLISNSKNTSAVTNEYSEFKTYEPYVMLYDLKGNKLAEAQISLTLKEKAEEASTETTESVQKEKPTALDPDSTDIPVAASGSFVCSTWINTSMDAFAVSGGTLTGADWGYSRGYRGYNLTGTCEVGESISLSISGTMGEMGYQMTHKGNDLILTLKVYDTSGKEITTLTQKKEVLKSATGSLSDSVTVVIPENATRVEMLGSFACSWITPHASASEMVAVSVKLKVTK